MKKNIYLFILCLFGLYSFAQPVTLNLPTTTVKQAMEEVRKSYGYSFVYEVADVDSQKNISLVVNNSTIEDVVKLIIAGQPLNFIVDKKTIVLSKAQPMSPASSKKIEGMITDEKGEAIIGANVVVKGTSNGTITNFDGSFSLDVTDPKAILVVSYVGYMSKEVAINDKNKVSVSLVEDTKILDEVVVTALGIRRKESSLTYANQQLGGEELTRAKDPNMVNTLAGKTAGVSITKSSAGLGGSAKVSIRGNRSAFASGNNQPLYVIDGVPMLNNSTESTSTVLGGENNGVNRDAGDGISNLNPDDIESMSILKGASAAALYGSQAANGVILITTKTGKAGMQKITFSSNITADNVVSIPQFQNSYGIVEGGTGSWGAKSNLTNYRNVENFFSTGLTAINSISFMGGNERAQTYVSYANTSAQGVIETNKLQKNNITLRESMNFFNNRLKIDANVNIMHQTIQNSPSSGGYYLNPLVGIYGFARGQDLGQYKSQFEKYDAVRNMNTQNWHVPVTEWEQNPYWITNRVTNSNSRFRALAALNVNFKITDWLTIQARGNVDYVNDKFQNTMYASTAATIAGSYEGKENGRYIWSDKQDLLLYGDIMALFNKNFGKFSINGALGASINNTTVNSLILDSGTASLYRPNGFTVSNINFSSQSYINQTIDARRTLQSVFGTLQLGYADALYLDVTARNDWSSTLANTASLKTGFFYPSVGVSWILTNSFEMPKEISFGKIRASWAQVGNDLPIGITNLADIILAGGGIRANDTEQRGDLKPEISSSIEAGIEWRFFDNRLGFDFTFYTTDTRNQLLRLPNPAGSLFAYRYINAGLIRNTGFELVLDATPVLTENFRWKTTFNTSLNRNKVVSLHPDYKEFVYGDEGFSMAYQMRIKEGGSLGDIYGNAFVRDDNGTIQVDDTGAPLAQTGNKNYLGNSNPDFLLGWGNTFSYKGVSLYFLIDSRFGGQVMSLTQADLDSKGVTAATGAARDNGFVEYGGQKFENVQGFYGAVGGRNGISEYYMYDATNIRLREVSLSYSLSKSALKKQKVVSGVDFSVIGRNLLFFYKKAPFDPDATMSVGNNNQGIDVFGMPTTRNVGVNIKITLL